MSVGITGIQGHHKAELYWNVQLGAAANFDIQIQLMNIHVSECTYYCLHLVPKFGNVRSPNLAAAPNWYADYSWLPMIPPCSLTIKSIRRPGLTANERRHYVATSSLIGRMHARNDPWCWICHNFIRVATVREKSGNFKSFSEAGKSQGISLQVREFCNLLSKSGNSKGISCVVHLMHNFHRLVNDIWTRTKSWTMSSFKYHSPNDFFSKLYLFSCFA